jgi:hypothetical protein
MEVFTRRRLLGMAVGVVGAPGWPLGGAPVHAADSRFQGCLLRAGVDALPDSIKLLPSSRDQEVDQLCAAVQQDLRREFRVSPETWFYDDVGGPNAFATTLPRRGSPGGDGTVCLGIRLTAAVTRRNELNRRWRLRLTAILAHEWAHIVQYTKGQPAPGKSTELHADFLAGWFLGRTTKGWGDARKEGMYRFYFLGDDQIRHPDHHGTPIERASAIVDGFDLAATVDTVDAAYRRRPL